MIQIPTTLMAVFAFSTFYLSFPDVQAAPLASSPSEPVVSGVELTEDQTDERIAWFKERELALAGSENAGNSGAYQRSGKAIDLSLARVVGVAAAPLARFRRYVIRPADSMQAPVVTDALILKRLGRSTPAEEEGVASEETGVVQASAENISKAAPAASDPLKANLARAFALSGGTVHQPVVRGGASYGRRR